MRKLPMLPRPPRRGSSDKAHIRHSRRGDAARGCIDAINVHWFLKTTPYQELNFILIDLHWALLTLCARKKPLREVHCSLLAREKRGLDTHPRQLIHHTSGSVSTRYTEIHAPKELLNARSVAGRISIAALVRAGSGGRASAVDQAVMKLSDEGGRCADKIGRRVARIVIADLDRVGRFFLHQPADQRLSGSKWLFAHCTR